MKAGIKQTRKVAPDGGWGWVATFGVSLVNLATRSIEPSFGLLFGDLLRDLDVGTTGAAIIISSLDIMMNFSGLFVGPLLKEFSYRKVAIVGALLCSLGLSLTSPANSMAHILVTYSVINGIGVGLATSAAFVALNHYFKKRRGQAVGLSMAGTAAGMLIMPQLVRMLLESYGFRGAVLLLSGISLHAAVGCILLQPAKWHLKDEEIDIEMDLQEMNTIKEDEEDSLPEIKNLLNENKKSIKKNFSEVNVRGLTHRPTFPRITSNASIALEMKKRKESVISHLSQLDFNGSYLQIHVDIGDDDKEELDFSTIRRVNTHLGMTTLNRDSFTKPYKTTSVEFVKSENGLQMAEKKPNIFKRVATIMDVDLLKDPIYLNILFGLSIFYVAEMNFKMVTPFFLANLGYTKTDVAFCLSMTAISDILARIILPPICDKIDISKRIIFLVSVFFVAITRSIMAEQTDWTKLMIWLSICGFFRGAALSNFTLTVSEYCSLDKLPAAFGWHMIGKAVFVCILGPLIGAIRDLTDSYPICIHAQSVCIFLCCLAWCIEFLIKRLRSKITTKSITTTTLTTKESTK